ncbi:MAG: acyltransferase [Polyangiaceae bacterium]
MKKMLIAVGYLPMLVSLLAVGSTGCKKKEEELPPAPSATPPPPEPAPAPTPVVIAPEEDAGAVDAGEDVKKPAAKAAPADVAGLRACCTALQQNAASMPPPNNAYAIQAASMCTTLVTALASGSATKAGALGTIGSLMKGANLPPAGK